MQRERERGKPNVAERKWTSERLKRPGVARMFTALSLCSVCRLSDWRPLPRTEEAPKCRRRRASLFSRGFFTSRIEQYTFGRRARADDLRGSISGKEKIVHTGKEELGRRRRLLQTRLECDCNTVEFRQSPKCLRYRIVCYLLTFPKDFHLLNMKTRRLKYRRSGT